MTGNEVWCLVDADGVVLTVNSTWDEIVGEREPGQALLCRYDDPQPGDILPLDLPHHRLAGDARIERGIRALGADAEPRAGWDAHILAAGGRLDRRARRLALAGIATAIIAIALSCLAAWLVLA